MNVDRLVEQARELRPAATGEAAYQFLSEAPGLLAGLADAVEQLQAEVANPRQDAGMAELWAEHLTERSRLEARVAALEAGIAEHIKVDEEVITFECSCVYGASTIEADDMRRIEQANERLWALLDGRVPSTGQETT